MNPAERLAAALCCAIFLVLLVWCGAPGVFGPSYAPVPAEVLLPENVSAALRLNRFEPAFARHWAGRGYPDTDTAIVELLKAIGPWEDWSRDIGERGLRRRVSAYREAFFQLLGPESWVVFGQWEDESPDSTETAFLMYLQEGAAVRLAVAPFLNLVLPDKKTQISRYRGIEILKYTDKEERNEWAMARLGGWVCISMRNHHSRALYRIIDQYLEADRNDPPPPAWFPPAPAGQANPPVSARMATDAFWKHFEDFSRERRSRGWTPGVEDGSASWRRQLRGISEFELTQAGESLLDLDLTFRGARVERLHRSIALRQGKEPDAPPITQDVMVDAELPLNALQIDFSYAMATRGLPFLGLKWKDFVKRVDKLKWLAPGASRQLKRSMYDDDGPPEARIGLAVTRSGGLALPGVTVWRDHPPILYTPHAPGDLWGMRARAGMRGGDDFLYNTVMGPQGDAADPRLVELERALARRLWSSPARPPEVFLVGHFDEVLRFMEEIPGFLVRGSDSFESILHLSRGLNLAAGSIAARLDVDENRATVRIRTLILPPDMTAPPAAGSRNDAASS
jgi:hypothetical protein